MTVIFGMSMFVYYSVFDVKVESIRIKVATSPSALGQGALLDLLKQLGYEVEVGRVRADEPALVIVSNPTSELDVGAYAGLPPGSAVLVVLPKRRGTTSPDGTRTILAKEVPAQEVESIIRRIDPSATVERNTKPGSWSQPKWPEPSIPGLQLVRSDVLEPLISAEGSLLFGRLRMQDGPPIHLLSDADLFATHAFSRGMNVELAVLLIDSLVLDHRRIVVDEHNRGVLRETKLEVALFEQPVVAVTIQMLALLLVVAWSALQSFGGKRAITPALKKGYATLLDNSAALLSDPRRCADLARRYTRTVLLDVSRRLNPPLGLSEEEHIAWLDGVARTRGLDSTYKDLQGEARALSGDTNVVRATHLARRLHGWRKGMIHADRTRSRHQ